MPAAKTFKLKGVYLIDNPKPNYKKVMEELFLIHSKKHIQEKTEHSKTTTY